MRGAPVAAYRDWKSLGVSPTTARKRLLNEPRLVKPTLWHTSVTVRFVEQKVLRPLDPAPRDVLRRGDAVRRLEEPEEVVLRQARSFLPAARGRAARRTPGLRGRGPAAGGPARRREPRRSAPRPGRFSAWRPCRLHPGRTYAAHRTGERHTAVPARRTRHDEVADVSAMWPRWTTCRTADDPTRWEAALLGEVDADVRDAAAPGSAGSGQLPGSARRHRSRSRWSRRRRSRTR